MFSINTLVNCGTFELKFYLKDGSQTPLNSAIFDDRRGPNLFATKLVTNISYVGVYKITYKVYLSNVAKYPSTSVE